jgi:hypothetical protein
LYSETRELGAETVASCHYQIHFSHQLETKDYDRFSSTTASKFRRTSTSVLQPDEIFASPELVPCLRDSLFIRQQLTFASLRRQPLLR